MSAGSVLLHISTQADTCNASGLSLQHSSIAPRQELQNQLQGRLGLQQTLNNQNAGPVSCIFLFASGHPQSPRAESSCVPFVFSE